MRFAFALLSPDCVLSGSAPGALRFMAERGVQVITYRWHCLSAGEVAALYASNRTSRPPTHLDSLVDELFSLSPSLCCLLSKAGLQDQGLHRFLLDVKGPSDPFNGRPDQLRRALGATNKILNLVHTSDSPADSLREAALFFPQIQGLADQTRSVETETLCNECPSGQIALSGFRTLNDVKHRVHAAGRWDDSHALANSLEREKQLLESQRDQVSLYPRLQKILWQQTRSATAVRSLDLRGLMLRLISISARTTGDPHSPSDAPASIDHMLQRAGVGASAWESLVMRAEESMAASPRLTSARA